MNPLPLSNLAHFYMIVGHILRFPYTFMWSYTKTFIFIPQKGPSNFTYLNKPLCWNIINLGLQQNIWWFHIHPNYYEEKCYFFSPSIRMSGKNVNFGDKIIKKHKFYRNKKVTKIDDIGVNKILVCKEEPHCTKFHLNTLLDITIMMFLEHYA